MSEQAVPIHRPAGRRFIRVVKSFLTSEVRGQALGLFALLIGLLFAISGLNVVNSYVGRDFMTAISGRDRAGFVRLAILYPRRQAWSTIPLASVGRAMLEPTSVSHRAAISQATLIGTGGSPTAAMRWPAPCAARPRARCARRYAPSRQAPASVRASRRSVFTRRLRVAYIGAKFGSATILSLIHI